MTDPDRYAAERADMLRDDWQFSRLFARQAQPGFTALLALRAELQQILVQVNEPAIVTMKLEWWRNEIMRGFQREAQHPLARALGHHLSKAGSAADYCIEIVDAAETESEGTAAFTDQDFRLYLYRSGGVLGEQLVQLSGSTSRPELDAGRRLAELKRFTDLVLAAGTMLHAGAWLLPASWLNERNLDVHQLRDTADSSELANHLVGELDRERVAARTVIEGVKLPPALALQWSLAQRDYDELRKNPRMSFSLAPAKGNAVLRLWAAWRAARRAATTRT